MKIKGRCRNCGRDFPIDMVTGPGNPGHCPFCGIPLDADYAAMLIDALRSLETIGTQMVNVLERTRAVGDNLAVDAESIIGPIREALVAREEASAGRRATREASIAEGVR